MKLATIACYLNRDAAIAPVSDNTKHFINNNEDS